MGPERPRVLIVITLAEAGGAQTYVASLLPALAERFDVTVAAFGPGPLRAAAESAGVRFVPLRHVRRPLNPLRDLLGLVELYRLCRRLQPHIVHANSSKAGILGRLAPWLAGVPVRIFTVHGWAFSAYTGLPSRLYLWADRLMRPLTTLVICVAQNERATGLEARTCRPDRTVVIRSAVDVARAPRARHDGAPPAIVSVGRFKAPKDFFTLVRSLGMLAPGSFRAMLVGEGPDRQRLEREVHDLGLERAVQLPGERDDVPELLATADVFALSSRSEGLPVSILEAMAAGLPVVASSVGGVSEEVVDGVSGLLVPPGDASALARALGRLVEDRELRRGLGAAGRARALEHFDLPEFRHAHLAVYEKLLAERELPATAP